MTPTPSAREPQATRTHLTCERCGLADATVKKQHVYTGCASDRPTPFYEIHNLHQSDDERDVCIDALRAAYDALAAEREALRGVVEKARQLDAVVYGNRPGGAGSFDERHRAQVEFIASLRALDGEARG